VGDLARVLVVLRGGGDLATGVAYRLHQAGFSIVVLERPDPLVVRRRVALATAVLERSVQVESLRGRLVGSPAEALQLAAGGAEIPVLISPELPSWGAPGEESPFIATAGGSPVSVVIDARMAKRNLDTHIGQAPLVVALGPGFTAGRDCHAVIETMRGHRLGRVIWRGSAAANTGTPGPVGGKAAERVLRAPADGVVAWAVEIGDRVAEGTRLGSVGSHAIHAPFAGVVRGLISPGRMVPAGLKIGDVDPRADVEASYTISDKALAIGGGVLEAVLSWLSGRR
jgi:xanthine dehydrogenase accessory factor